MPQIHISAAWALPSRLEALRQSSVERQQDGKRVVEVFCRHSVLVAIWKGEYVPSTPFWHECYCAITGKLLPNSSDPIKQAQPSQQLAVLEAIAAVDRLLTQQDVIGWCGKTNEGDWEINRSPADQYLIQQLTAGAGRWSQVWLFPAELEDRQVWEFIGRVEANWDGRKESGMKT